jgi:hypothetical protein
MKPAEFIRWAEAYYGNYRPVVKEELLVWLTDKKELFITGLRERVKKEYSNQYRIPPDIAILEGFTGQATYDEARRVLKLTAENQGQIGGEQKSLGCVE